jgi:hypothetical protein
MPNFVFICKTDYSKPVKQEVNGTVILPSLVFPAQASCKSLCLDKLPRFINKTIFFFVFERELLFPIGPGPKFDSSLSRRIRGGQTTSPHRRLRQPGVGQSDQKLNKNLSNNWKCSPNCSQNIKS